MTTPSRRGIGVPADVLARASCPCSSLLTRFRNPLPSPAFGIEPGARADYEALSPFHYRAAAPATILHTLRTTEPGTGDLAAILTISMPTRNGAWRALAWPGDYDTPDRAANLRRLNAEVRCISRVIIDPRYRALGLATALVRQYLARPLTPRTEALAAMGPFAPFFEKAGMTPRTLPDSPRDTRLRAALRHARLHPEDLLRPRALSPPLLHALRRWANDSGATRTLLRAPPPQLARAAATALTARPTAYTHEKQVAWASSP